MIYKERPFLILSDKRERPFRFPISDPDRIQEPGSPPLYSDISIYPTCYWSLFGLTKHDICPGEVDIQYAITFNILEILEILVFWIILEKFMKLTRRQEEFIENLADLTREVDGPIHYSILAERLGVSPFTAYDMLRLLEEKGMVTSEYQVAEGKSGPGRAERLFCPVMPNDHKQRIVERFGGMDFSQEELKQFLLEQAHQGEFPQKELVEELLARVPPDGPEEIRYCVGIMMVIALRLRQHNGHQKFLAYLSDIMPLDGIISPANLCLLGGFAFGIMSQEETEDHEWSQILLEHILQYQEIVRCMAPKESQRLADDLMLVFTPLTEEKVAK